MSRGLGDVYKRQTAHELAGAARGPAWELVVERFPMYATYQRKTTRQIPVFALKRR